MSLTSILAWTLLHFVWQGALLTAGLVLALVALRRSGAHARYRAGVATMLLLVVAPIATAARLSGPSSASPTSERTASVLDVERATPVGRVARPQAAEASAVVTPGRDVHTGSPLATTIPRAFTDRARAWAEAAAPVLVGTWLVGVLLLSVRFGGGWLRVRRLTREQARPASPRDAERLTTLARRLGIVTTVRLLESALVQVPTVIGWLQPVVLVPLSLQTGLSPRDLELLLAHELAHIRRQDYLVNLLQTVVETVLFYHPGVWWVSRQVREEREHCCDDIAVALCDDRTAYATALLRLEELRRETPLLAVAATGGHLLRRIRRLVAGPSHHAETRTRWAAIPLGAAALAGIGGWATSPALVMPRGVTSPPAATAEAEAREERPSSAVAMPQVRGAAPDTVIRHGGAGTLEERWAWAEASARRRGSVAFWIGYTIAGDARRGLRYIDRRIPVYGNGMVSMGSLRTRGSVAGLTFQGIRLDSLLGPGEPEDQVVFLGFIARGGRMELDRVHASAYSLPGHFAGRTLFWLGHGPDDASVALMRRQFDASPDREHRRDLVDVVGMHLDGAVVLRTFRTWLSGEPSEDVRREVAHRLSDVWTPEALAFAARLARGDRSREVQREAAEAIGEMEVTGALDTLTALARTLDTRDVRREAVESLGERPEPQAFDVLVRIAWDDQDDEVQREAVETLGETHDPRAARELERIVREHPRTEVRREAVEALGELEEPGTVLPMLRRIVDEDASADVRREAIEAIGELQTGAARDALKQYARSGREPEVRREAIETMADQGDHEEVLGLLMEIVNGSAGESDQAIAVEQLGDVNDGRVVPQLFEIATTHPAMRVRRVAVEQLGNVGESAARDALLRLMGSNAEPSLRRLAIESYADAATATEVVREMRALLNGSAAWEIQAAALEALEGLDDVAGIEAVIEVARSHPNRDLRRRALEVLGDSDDPLAVKALTRLLDRK